MTFEEAAKLTPKAKVNELLLTHFSPSIDEPEIFRQNAIKIFPNTTIGHDGMKKVIKL